MPLNISCPLVIRVGTILVFVIIVYLTIVAYLKHDSILNKSFTDEQVLTGDSDNDAKLSQDYIRSYFNRNDNQLNKNWIRTIQRYIRLPLESSYGSHKLVLLAASILTRGGGAVMELGCGYHSTVLLHQIVVVEQKRYLLSTDTDHQWLQKFESNMSSSLHQFRHIKATSEWDKVGNDRPKWSFAFIDHKPGERRVIDLIRLANVTDIVILHDTETSSYNYEPGFAQYPYRYRYNYLSTHTDVMSQNNATLFYNIRHLLELTIKLKLAKQ